MFKTIKKFYQFLFHYKKAFIAFGFVFTIAILLDNSTSYIYKFIVDAIPSKNYHLLMKIVVVFVGVKIASNLSYALARYLGDKALIPAARDARLKVFRRIQDLDFVFHTNKNTGALISAFKRGDNAFFSIFDNFNQVFEILIGLTVVAFCFSNIAPIIAFLMLGIFFINAVVSIFLIKINLKKRSAFNESEDRISGIITDNLLNYETVKFFAQEQKEENRLRKQFVDWYDKLYAFANSFRIMDITIGTISSIGMLAIFGISINRLATNRMSAGDLVMIVSFTNRLYWHFFRILYELRAIAKRYVDMEKYFSILDNEILIKDPEKPTIIRNMKGDIKFEDVGFDYPDGKQDALIDFNLHIKPGDSIAFVGRSGAGKTTIVKMLLRFYDVNSGRILIDDIDIRNLTKSQLRSFIGIVPQEPILFNNTIGFNIAYGKNRVSKKDTISAAKMANLHDFIDGLPLKYKTPVGERGIKLSGGQKQRLAIARMFLTNPSVIIFDEATSNLDSESEGLIQDALWKIAKNRTVLIIAHRFSTIRKVGRIVVLEGGKIVEMGSHNQLIRKKGIYRHLWQLQSQGKKQKSAEALI